MSSSKPVFRFTNTLSGSVEPFSPNDGKTVRMYTCGPTAYDVAHIGNFRAALLPDVLARALHSVTRYSVHAVMNVTDFGHLAGDREDTEDKMTQGLIREGKERTLSNMIALGKKYGELYFDDLRTLNIDSFTHTPYASSHVKEQIAWIERLIQQGVAYETEDAVYFNVPKSPGYGALGGVTTDRESRLEHKHKLDVRDFALWKKNPSLGWESPWGRGFPGWHIECTAMATKYLGESFDIHTGGMDLIPVHHNNEIAQAEVVATEKPYARFWLHNAFITIDNEKISKSLGNVVVLKDVLDRGYDPLSLRYWLLSGHYRSQMNFTWEALRGAHTALMKVRGIVSMLPRGWFVRADEGYMQAFNDALMNDLNTSEAIAVLWKLLKDTTISPQVKRKTSEEMDKVLGIASASPLPQAPLDIRQLLKKRDELRKQGKYEEGDALRDLVAKRGYEVQDGDQGSTAIPVPKI